MKRERTPWYPPSAKPVRVGMYQRDLGSIGIRWSWWNGRYWCGFADRWSHAAHNGRGDFKSAHQDAHWRGVVAPVERGSA